jgi:protein SCO1/2
MKRIGVMPGDRSTATREGKMRMHWRSTIGLRLAGLALAGLGAAVPALAHEGHSHSKGKAPASAITDQARPKREGAAHLPTAAPLSSDQFLGGAIGGDFDLIDQDGNRRRRSDFAGRNVLLFFGYVRCESICSAAIPLMTQAVDRLGEKGKSIDLVIVTVDPDRDTPEGLRAGLLKYDRRLIGLTGSRDDLEPVWRAFQISTKEVARDWLDQPVFAHGSFIYLLGPKGEVQTLLPPILSAERLAAIMDAYLPR